MPSLHLLRKRRRAQKPSTNPKKFSKARFPKLTGWLRKRLKNKALKEKTVETRMIELIESEKEIENKALDIKSQMEAEVEFLGNPVITKSTLPDNVYGVIEIKNQFLKLYQLNSGEVLDYRVKKTDMAKNSPFGLYNIIRVSGIKKQNKKKKDGDSWITLENEFNTYISSWDVIL